MFPQSGTRFPPPKKVPPDPWADRLALHGSYYDESGGAADRLPRDGARRSASRSCTSPASSVGLLGIGSGGAQGPGDGPWRWELPIKVSTATSNFMIGVTAAARRGPSTSRAATSTRSSAAPVACGVLIGATAGSHLLGKTQKPGHPRDLRHRAAVGIDRDGW